MKKPKMSENKQRIFLSLTMPPKTDLQTEEKAPEDKLIEAISEQFADKEKKPTIYVLRNHESETRSALLPGVVHVTSSQKGTNCQ